MVPVQEDELLLAQDDQGSVKELQELAPHEEVHHGVLHLQRGGAHLSRETLLAQRHQQQRHELQRAQPTGGGQEAVPRGLQRLHPGGRRAGGHEPLQQQQVRGVERQRQQRHGVVLRHPGVRQAVVQVGGRG